MSSNDLIKLISKFNEAKVNFCDNSAEYENEVASLIKKMEQFEKPSPDGYSKIGNKVLIIEHFEFDSAQKIYKGKESKGSKNRKELDRVEKEVKKSLIEGNNFSKNVINCKYNIEQYIQNAISGFENHYKKIPSYKEHLRAENIINDDTETKVMFLIEDITPLTNLDCKSKKPIILVKCDKFLDIFEKNKHVDYILCFSEDNKQDDIFSDHKTEKNIYFLSQSSIENYRNNELKVNEIEIIDLGLPQVSAFIYGINPPEI